MLRLPRFQLHVPATIDDAAVLLREHRAAEQDVAKTGTPGITVMLVAGGTDLYPNMKRRQFTPSTLIALGRALPKAIQNGGTLRIGAGATLTAVAGDEHVLKGYRALAESAIAISTPQLRNMGTIGGDLLLRTPRHLEDQAPFFRMCPG